MTQNRFNGGAVAIAGLIGGGVGFSVALFLRSLILNTPAQVKPTTFYWWFVLLSGAGALWGVATLTMKQLERIQGYRQRPWRDTGRSAGDSGRGRAPGPSQDTEADSSEP